MSLFSSRRFPIGAELTKAGINFRVWAPERQSMTALLQTGTGIVEVPLEKDAHGYFSGTSKGGGAGTKYRFQMDGESNSYPDPASRFQPEGPHGPSQVIDPNAFDWTDSTWSGVKNSGQILYEMHIGTFSREGTWKGAEDHLPHLAELGVTVLELMPVGDFSGNFGWGYDGVNLFASTRLYGSPDDFRSFVNRAHELKLGVILDVVYNHFGPDGNYLQQFSKEYNTDHYTNDWGAAVNYDDTGSESVREFVKTNVAYWIQEFHLDGFRIDATQNICDTSKVHILQEMTTAARKAAGRRSIIVVAENESQEACHVLPPEAGGYGMDGLWNDDLHHTAMVALSGHNEAYYTDYKGTPQEFISAFKWGYLYQGQYYKWQKKRRGTSSLKLKPANFVTFMQNHDQVANSGGGLRCHQFSDPGRYRAMTALMLLGPGTPMLFHGQEFAASSKFFYFAHHEPDLAKLVAEGRLKFLSQFPSLASPEMQEAVPDPADKNTFERCKLDWSECMKHAAVLEMHRDLLKLRRSDPLLSGQSRNFDGAVLGQEAFVLRFFDESGDDRLLLVNLGRDLPLNPAPEPLLAEPAGCEWELTWSSEDHRYGGMGTPPLQRDDNWFLPGHTTVYLTSRKREPS